jgi:biopolymer transport protein ExbD
MENPSAQMNVTPLIDVLLVLLIFFIVTVPALTHTVGLDLPTGAQNPRQVRTIDVDIDFDGKVYWNGTLAPDDQSLEKWFRAMRHERDVPLVRVYPDKRAPYERVAQVLAAAQRAHVPKLAMDSVAD